MSDVELVYGPHGELLPPPLILGESEEELIERLAQDCGQPMPRRKTRDWSQWLDLAILYAHGRALQRVLSGDCRTELERALWHAVLYGGESISLQAPTRTYLEYRTFVPVLSTNDRGRVWRFGAAAKPKMRLLVGDGATVVANAQRLLFAWAIEEEA